MRWWKRNRSHEWRVRREVGSTKE
ncbi:hypothetical protein LINPERPRIM_LOCUS38973 [Linum perenne]